MSINKKKSLFKAQTSLADTDFFDFVRSGQNFKVSFANFKGELGITGTLQPIGSSTGSPTMTQSGTVYSFRALESGPGASVGLSAQNGIQVRSNFSQDATGVKILDDLSQLKYEFPSFVEGDGISITKNGNAITLRNTIDPASGLENRIVVENASDLAGTLDSAKEYFIDGVVDMGSQKIEVPAGGLNLSGYNFNLSKLVSSEPNYKMFTSPVGGSGDLLGKDYAIEVTGTNSQVYDLTSTTGFQAFEFARINYNNCSSLGVITNYRQGLEAGTGRFGGKPELTLDGAWAGGYFIDTSIVRVLDDGPYTLFKAGPTFTMASRFRTNQNVDLPANASFIDFSASNFINPSTLQLDGVIISRNGAFDATDTNILPNVDSGDLISEWMGNNGISNTFVGGELSISAESATVITVTEQFEDISGTFLVDNLEHFDSPASGQLRHLGDSPREYKVSGQFVLSSSANDEVDLKVVIFRSATTTFEDGKTIRRVINNLQGGRNVAYFGVEDNITLNKNDYVKLQVAQVSPSTDDITAELDSFFVVEAR